MKEQFDKRLVEKIKDSFNNYEEPYDPREWEKLSKAYFKPKKKAWVVYWPFLTAGVAASLFLVFFFWPLKKGWQPEMETIVDSLGILKDTADQEIDTVSESTRDNLVDSYGTGSENKPSQPNGKEEAPGSIEPDEPNRASSDPSYLASEEAETEHLGGTSEQERAGLVEALDEQEIHVGEFSLAEVKDERNESVQSPEASNNAMDVDEAKEILNQWLAEETGKQESDETQKASLAPLKLGVLVSPQASSNAISGMNLGAGVMSEFSLSRKLKLDVGLTFARQSLTPDVSPGVVLAMDAKTDSPAAMNSQYSMVQNIRTSSNFAGSSYRLSFASLDIPLNLKYQVMENRNSGFFLITGLSSMIYLNQTATETFQTNSFFTNTAEGVGFAPSVQEFTTVFTPESRGNLTDIGRMLNLSVGYEYNLKNGMFISVEPFYKLPLGNLTFVNQQFSIGGMNLRMNFNLRK